MSSTDTQPDEAGAKPSTPEETPKAQHAFSRVTRDISDTELASPGARKLLLELLRRAEVEGAALASVRDRLNSADISNAKLEEQLKVRVANKVISMGCLAVGAAAIGYAPGLWSDTNHPSAAPFCLGFGIVLICVAIWAEVIRK
jgi:hypothetical protein